MKVLLSALLSSAVVLAAPTPPGIPSESSARSLLNGLNVAPAGSSDGYDRDKFPHWKAVEGNCNAREYVLRRDGNGVSVDGACEATSGTWTSPYDGATWSDTSDVDIDHMVPLENAWISGASSWTESEREALANDVTHPQLWAVTDNVNSSKGARSPDEWKPPLESFYCEYAESWIKVKSYYDLSVTSAEYYALHDMLNTC